MTHLNIFLDLPKTHCACSQPDRINRQKKKEHGSLENTANMSWRNQGITGSNNIPLGKVRRFGADAADGDGDPASILNSMQSPSSNGDMKRGRSPESEFSTTFLNTFYMCYNVL